MTCPWNPFRSEQLQFILRPTAAVGWGPGRDHNTTVNCSCLPNLSRYPERHDLTTNRIDQRALEILTQVSQHADALGS